MTTANSVVKSSAAPMPLIVKDRDVHSNKVTGTNNVTIIPHAHTKPENLSAPPGRYPTDFVPKPAHMTKSSIYSHVIPKVPQVGMVVKPNEKLVKKKTTVASLLAQSRVQQQQQQDSATNSRSNSPETNNIDVRSSPTSAPHRPWVNNPAPLVIPSVKKPQQPLPPPPGKKHQQIPASHKADKMLKESDQDKQLSCQQQSHPRESPSPADASADNSIPNSTPASPADLTEPLNKGWKRETLLKGLGVQGLSGEVVYITPTGVKCKTLSDVKKQLVPGLSIKMFSFSSRLLIGDFLLPTSANDEQSTTLKLSATQLASWLSSEGEENKKEEARQKEERERKKQHSVLIRGEFSE